MFFILSKVLFYLIMPITWILGFLLSGLLIKNPRKSRLLLWSGMAAILVFSNPHLMNEAWILWEKEPVPMDKIGRYDAAILLTGFTSLEKSPHDRVYTNKGADRLLHTVMLYKLGHVKKIIVSGGLGLLRETKFSEATEVKTLLLLAGVPETDIILENKSHNTHENAVLTKKLLTEQHPELKSFVLVTSAFHMRRASACFKKAGIRHQIFPADFYSSDRMFRFEFLIPSEETMSHWHRLVHEVAGFLIYKVMGYC